MKRMLALFCAVGFAAALATACGKTQTDDAGITADAMADPYGGVSQALTDALQSSGNVTLYWDTSERSDQEQDFAAYFEKYYGGTVEFRFCPFDDEGATFLRDMAAGDLPDVFRLTPGLWPRAALRNMSCSVAQLKEQGALGLNHPALEKYRDMTEAAFSYNGACYALSICYASPAVVAVNRELFNSYMVKSPELYYQEGNWTYETLLRCCNELGRTVSGQTTIYGACLENPLWFLQANDADPMLLSGSALTCGLLSTRSLHSLAFCRSLIAGSAFTTDPQDFLRGETGLLCDTADALAPILMQCAFDWEILPFPYGADNVSGDRPGTVIGWSVSTGCRNVQGAVNFILARQVFSDFFYNVDQGALWDTGYAQYSEKQRALILSAATMVRPACFPHMGNLPEQEEAFWAALKGNEPVYDVAERFAKIIQAQIRAEMGEQVQMTDPPSH